MDDFLSFLDIGGVGAVWYGVAIDALIKSTVILLLAVLISSYKTKKVCSQSRHFLFVVSIGSVVLIPLFYKIQKNFGTPVLKLFESSNGIEEFLVQGNLPYSTLSELGIPVHSLDYTSSSWVVNWQLVIFAIWLSGFLLLNSRLLAGIRRVKMLKSNSVDVTAGALGEKIKLLSQNLRISRLVRCYISDSISTPFTYGTFRPVIFLPCEACQWGEEQQKMTLLHELFHIKRYDNLSGIVAQFILTLYWFNPLIWICVKNMKSAQEYACDDRVVDFGIKPYVYASFLLEIFKDRSIGKVISGVAYLLQRTSHLEKRIKHILKKTTAKNRMGLKIITFVTCMLVVCSVGNVFSYDQFYRISDKNIHVKDYMVSVKGFSTNMDKATIFDIPMMNFLPAFKNFQKMNYYYTKEYFLKNKINIRGISIEKGRENMPMTACADGTVTDVGFDVIYGDYVVIDHKYGFQTVYTGFGALHYVHKGKKVLGGSLLGFADTDNTIHFALLNKNEPIDPIPFLKVGTTITLD